MTNRGDRRPTRTVAVNVVLSEARLLERTAAEATAAASSRAPTTVRRDSHEGTLA
jgi:hypothetical protein